MEANQIDNAVLIERGIAAENLLADQAFNAVINDLLNYYIQSLIQSTPDQETMRNAAYYQSRAVNDVIAVLRQWVAIKDQLNSSEQEEYDYE
jgi:hypothetical protein